MATHKVRVGLHARNDVRFPEPDFALIRQARIETLKMMSFTDLSVYERLRRENPGIEFIVRLYDDRMGPGSQATSAEFVARMVPIIRRLRPYTTKFEIHNEPNHADGVEGWGASDKDARAFRDWYMQVLPALKKACPWAQFGFPGLAVNHPHRDLEWLGICRDAVRTSDWLGCHCYWQHENMLSDDWGQRFKHYQERFPDKRIEITEFGDSTPNRSRDQIAQGYARYYRELCKYPYLASASAFIASSPDPAWAPFAWLKEGGEMQPVVQAVGQMSRKPVEVPMPKSKAKPPAKPPAVAERSFPETGKTVRGNFLNFLERLGLDICGYPITGQIEEEGLPTQYFQRVGLEEFEPGKIRLKMLGVDFWASRERVAALEAQVVALGGSPLAGTGPAKPPVVDIAGQLSCHPEEEYPTRSLAEIDAIVIHHTATGATITPQQMAEYHVEKLGKARIIYHFFVAADGTIYQTNELETVSDHAYGQSRGSVGLCFAGNFSTATPTEAQLQSGGRLCAWLLDELDLSPESIVGLREIAQAQSPGEQWLAGRRWKDKLLARTKAAAAGNGDRQAAYILSLRKQIALLQNEIERMRREGASPQPAPSPGIVPIQIGRPPIHNMIDELARHEEKQYETRPRSAIETLVIHHSAVPAHIGPKSIASYHVNKLDWPGAGYHFMLSADGVIYQANALETVSHHAAEANPCSVGICFLGNFMTEVPPAGQLQAGAHLVSWLLEDLGIGLDEVKGHGELMQTSCPGHQWLHEENWKETLRQEIARV